VISEVNSLDSLIISHPSSVHYWYDIESLEVYAGLGLDLTYRLTTLVLIDNCLRVWADIAGYTVYKYRCIVSKCSAVWLIE
jgi:hypothetical protein